MNHSDSIDITEKCTWDLVADTLFILNFSVLALGIFLRLFMIGDQLLLDDEWHSLHYVIGKDFGYLLAHFALPGATCIPQNVYNLLLLRTIGWSEITLRLPSILAGLLTLVLFPVLVRPLLGRRSLFLFTALLAISPFLVFYSRMARPYSMFVAFGFASLMFGYNWLSSGRRADCLAYLLTGILAIESHLFALPVVFAPLLVGSLFKLWRQRRQAPLTTPVAPSWQALATCGAALTAVIGLLQGPALLGSIGTTMNLVAGRDTMTARSAWNGLCLLSGTAEPVLAAIFIALLLYGLWSLYRSNTIAAGLFVTVVITTLAALTLLRPDSIDAAMVVARYCIVFFPIGYLLAAKGFDDLLTSLQTKGSSLPSWKPLPDLLALCFAAALFSAGPWRQIYERPNSFTNHSAFQQSYGGIDWDRFYFSDMVPRSAQPDKTVRRADLSPFYLQLQKENTAGSIVEFPMMIGDHVNPYYYFQHFHNKRVLIGYDGNFPESAKPMPGYVHASSYVDEVLSRVGDRRKIWLRKMLDMTDIHALRQSGARYIVLHPHIEAELSLVAAAHPGTDRLEVLYERSFGPPVYRDGKLEVFRIEREVRN